MILCQGGGRVEFPGVKYANPYLVPEHNIPKVGNTILPDLQRQSLVGTNANEYKIGVGFDGHDVDIPTIVGGQYLGNEGAVERYKLTGERFKSMADPGSYSKFYDMISRLGIINW